MSDLGSFRFQVNPDIDRAALRAEFDRETRIQIRNVLTDETARMLAQLIASGTDWGLAWQGGDGPPQSVRSQELRSWDTQQQQVVSKQINQSMAGSGYAFMFHQYPMLDAYLQRWNPDSIHDVVLEHINDAPFLDLVRDVTGFSELVKADAQATLYAPGQFLTEHNDSHVNQGWRVAYVLNLTTTEWRPDWGGYLMFFDENGDVVRGFRPRFNSLNLLAVPQSHNVSYVPPFAPLARLAITGWFRDR